MLIPTASHGRSRRRWTAIAGLLAAVVVALPAAARADQGQVFLDAQLRGSALAINSAGKSVPVWYSAGAVYGTPLPSLIKAEIDTSASKAIEVQLQQPSPGCQTTSATLITCQRSPSGHFAPNGDLRLRLTPAPGAAVGDTAEITVTVTAPDVETSVNTFDLTVAAAGPDLQIDSHEATVAPTRVTAARPTIRNSGDQVAPTILLALAGGSYTSFPVHYRNCHYYKDSYGFESGVCLLKDVDLAPGESIIPAKRTPLPIQVTSTVPGQLRINALDPPGQPYQTYLSYSVDAFDTTPVDDRLSWPLGTGPVLKWDRAQASGVRTPALAEADPEDNYGSDNIYVSPDNPTDIAAEGASVTGAVGAVVPVTVGIRNLGPADVEATPAGKGGDPSDPYDAGLRFIPPKNTEVVDVTLPPGFYYEDWYEQTTSEGTTYLVLPYSLTKGSEYTVQFTLRITAAGTGTGTVIGQGGTSDPVKSNNTATVTVTSS